MAATEILWAVARRDQAPSSAIVVGWGTPRDVPADVVTLFTVESEARAVAQRMGHGYEVLPVCVAVGAAASDELHAGLIGQLCSILGDVASSDASDELPAGLVARVERMLGLLSESEVSA